MMRCRLRRRRRRNHVTVISCSLLLIIFSSMTYLHVYILVPAVPQYVNFTTTSAVNIGFENGTSDLFAGAVCDEECNNFRQLLQSWLPTKPKALIYFLVQKSSLKLLKKSLYNLDRFFNNRYHYPVVIFCEEDLYSDAYFEYVRSVTNSTVFFQQVKLKLPSFLTKPVPQEIVGKKRVYDVGYRHMCRFHAKTVYEQPVLTGVEFAWRLDHDSFITREIGYDVFQMMQQQHFTYGFIKVFRELPLWTTGLWDAARKYINVASVKTEFFNKWPRDHMYYNNFEISRLSLWLSDDYQRFIDYIDHLGGIYYHRWGDAPIKSIAVAMFVPRHQTHHFKDIGYRHQFFNRP